MRALPKLISRAAVALLLLALCAAPLARGAAALAPKPHACCPQAPAEPEPAPPCQQMAPMTCCLEVGVPPAPSAPERPDAPALGLPPGPLAEPLAADALCRAVRSAPEAPPLDPLSRTCVLLL